MEETVPIIHSDLVRRNSFFSENPYGANLSHLRRHLRVSIDRQMTEQEPARTLEGDALQWSRTQSHRGLS